MKYGTPGLIWTHNFPLQIGLRYAQVKLQAGITAFTNSNVVPIKIRLDHPHISAEDERNLSPENRGS
jgi:hypothetical protein